MSAGRQRGFTLIEVLVASVILAVMGVMAYRGVTEARVAVANSEGHLDRLREVQRAMQVVATDFRTLTRRPVREPIGDGMRPALLRDPNAVALVELSRAGWPTRLPAAIDRSGLAISARQRMPSQPARAATQRSVERAETSRIWI